MRFALAFFVAITASSSYMALSTVATTVAAQPRPLSQFLSESPAASVPPNPNNPFLSANSPSSAWSVAGVPNSNANPSAIAKPPVSTAAAANDLDTRLAEIAGQFSISDTTSPSMNSEKPSVALAIASGSNHWLGPGGVLQPTPVSNPALANQV